MCLNAKEVCDIYMVSIILLAQWNVHCFYWPNIYFHDKLAVWKEAMYPLNFTKVQTVDTKFIKWHLVYNGIKGCCNAQRENSRFLKWHLKQVWVYTTWIETASHHFSNRNNICSITEYSFAKSNKMHWSHGSFHLRRSITAVYKQVFKLMIKFKSTHLGSARKWL